MSFANVNPRLRDLAPYVPGKPLPQLERELGITDSVKLASNENPRGPSDKVRACLQQAAEDMNRYPDPSGFELKKALSGFLNVDENQITLGNGSNDVLELIARVAMEPGQEAIVDERCFVVYPLAISAAYGVQVTVSSKEWGHDLTAMLDAVTEKTRLIYIANPNNPTGTWITESEMVAFLDALPPSVWVVLDEAYFEYAAGRFEYPDGLELTRKYPNLIVTRTFSKAYGLAALRIGYSISNPEFADFLNRIRQPFNANSVALLAAETALADQDYIRESIQLNETGMEFLSDRFNTLGLPFIPSLGNFISVETGPNTAQLYEKLLRKGVIVRPIANYLMPNHLRVTVGTEEENSRFIQALTESL
ncbi:MAG: histidinol-phosphate transaminase [Gammaproteobacteria bacterium]|nr:histidinol-phosphate transaminase [Gammaproteobacteria bacterium]